MTVHIRTLVGICPKTIDYGGCGECQASCQSARKTSITEINLVKNKRPHRWVYFVWGIGCGVGDGQMETIRTDGIGYP